MECVQLKFKKWKYLDRPNIFLCSSGDIRAGKQTASPQNCILS